ncbi:MAG: ABC transporter permease, partial [Candidatus Binatia bacterium]
MSWFKLNSELALRILAATIAILFVVLWELIVRIFSIPAYLIPAPTHVISYLVESWWFLLPHFWITLYETVAGFALALVVGVPLGALIVWSRVIDKTVTPFLIVSQTFPKIALAPLLLLWLGFGAGLKIVVAFLVSFFPIVISCVSGLRSLETEMLELARSSQASGAMTFYKVRLPWALPQLFAGMKVAIAFALVGSVVGEWVGADQGLGYVLIWANGNMNSEIMFAVFVLLSVIGGGLYYLICAIETLC